MLSRYWLCKVLVLYVCFTAGGSVMAEPNKQIKLPKPELTGEHSIEMLLQQRRSVRSYQKSSLNLAEVGQLLWSAQGVSDAQGFRTAPSAGALYPLKLFVVVGEVNELSAGIYQYNPEEHSLLKTVNGDFRKLLQKAALNQSSIGDAAIIFVFTAIYRRTTWKYGDRGMRYVHMEVGHAGQNLFLQAEALHLGTVVIGAFNDDEVRDVLSLDSDIQPLSLMSVGRK
ncbi:MAG: SagB/ThcOx family dehydrogenase [Gammaproteobacteria bacterium]|nr:SagB/ThcOx family dehydrogenase [Gammaproteobacteria bacterium]